jgi:hypothetical protein
MTPEIGNTFNILWSTNKTGDRATRFKNLSSAASRVFGFAFETRLVCL